MIRAALCLLCLILAACRTAAPPMSPAMESYTLNYDTPADPALQARIEAIDASLRARYGMTPEQAAVGVLDLRRPRLAMTYPDRIEYAASVAKVGILLAYFAKHPEAASHLEPQTRH